MSTAILLAGFLIADAIAPGQLVLPRNADPDHVRFLIGIVIAFIIYDSLTLIARFQQ